MTYTVNILCPPADDTEGSWQDDPHVWWENYILSPEFAHLDFFEKLDYLCNFNARKTIGSNLIVFDSEADFTMFLLRFS